jgi:hypothetical protein
MEKIRVLRREFPKRCNKCGTVYTFKRWQRLPLLGLQNTDWGEILEFRNCACGTTLAIQLVEGEPE